MLKNRYFSIENYLLVFFNYISRMGKNHPKLFTVWISCPIPFYITIHNPLVNHKARIFFQKKLFAFILAIFSNFTTTHTVRSYEFRLSFDSYNLKKKNFSNKGNTFCYNVFLSFDEFFKLTLI